MAGMTVTDIIERVQRTFGDESGVQVTEGDIIRWINDAQREAVMQNEGLLQAVGYIDSVDGTDTYDLPDDLFTLHHLNYKAAADQAYFTLKWFTLKEMSEFVDGWDGSTLEGVPLIYTKESDGQFTVFPKPEASVASGFKLIYSRFPTAIASSSDSLDLPPYLHTYIKNYCLMQAYEMDEDWEAAQNKATQVQGDLDFNNNRKFWFGRDAYPVISVGRADQEPQDGYYG